MPVPQGFFELSPVPGALGPFAEGRPAGVSDPDYPAFGRYRLYWGQPAGVVPPEARSYPAPVLYGGPGPQGWIGANLGRWVASWAATQAPRETPGQWLVGVEDVALLVPPEALIFPWQSFRWTWILEPARPDVYQIEGSKSAPLFRNLRTGQADKPGAFGFGTSPPLVIAGERVALVAETKLAAEKKAGAPSAEDYADPPDVTTWVTREVRNPEPAAWVISLNDLAGEAELGATSGGASGWSWYIGRQLNRWKDPIWVGPWVKNPANGTIYHWLRDADAWHLENSLVTGQPSPELGADVWRWTGKQWVHA